MTRKHSQQKKYRLSRSQTSLNIYNDIVGQCNSANEFKINMIAGQGNNPDEFKKADQEYVNSI